MNNDTKKVDQNHLNKYSAAYYAMRPRWQTALDLYEPIYSGGFAGSAGICTLSKYIVRHPSEDDAEFARRAARVNQVNAIAMVVEFYVAQLFSTHISYSAEKHQDEVNAFWTCCNQRGDSLIDHYREEVVPLAFTFGVVDEFVDKPSSDGSEPVSLAEEQERKLDRPYVFVCPPLNRVRWHLAENGQYTYYQSRDVIDTEIQPNFQIESKEQYQCWDLKTITKFDKSGNVISKSNNPYGYIPAVPVIPIRSQRFYRDAMGKALIDDIIDLQREVLNTFSMISDFHVAINWAMLTIIQDTDNDEAVPEQKELTEAGNHRALALKGKGSKAMMVSPDPAGVTAMSAYADQLLDKMFQIELIPIDSNTIKTHTSAKTIRNNFAQLYARLSRIAKQFERSMKSVIDMALRVQGLDPVEANVKVNWSTNFSADSLLAALEQLQAMRNAAGDISPTAIKEFTKKVFAGELYNSTATETIEAEIDAWKPEDPAEQIATPSQSDAPDDSASE